MEEERVRKLEDVIDMSYLPGESKWNYTGRMRDLVREMGLEGWCCMGDALIDVYKNNVDSWNRKVCVLGLVSDQGQGHWCIDDIRLCSRYKGSFGGLTPDEKLARAFCNMKENGDVYRMSECRWRDDSE